jgi:OsmC subfamily peroxiredoxin
MPALQRTASATWNGTVKEGQGQISAASGVLSNTPYRFATRFENQPGTNPEELIAAAHAACYSKDYNLEDNGDRIETVLPQINDAIQRNQLDRKWTVNSERLVNKLKALSPCQTLALVDAIERFWILRQSNPSQTIQEILLEVDLIQCCDFAL